jgi:hypothetical protein
MRLPPSVQCDAPRELFTDERELLRFTGSPLIHALEYRREALSKNGQAVRRPGTATPRHVRMRDAGE